jgi:hypothetical protein
MLKGAIAAIILLVATAANIQAQHAYRLSEKDMKELLKRIEKQSESFRSSLKSALEHSRFDDTKAEDRINDFVKDFEKATEHLRGRFDEDRSASPEAEEVLRRAARIDGFMERHRLTPRAQSDWAALRSNLEALAEAYNVSWSWNESRR